MFKKFKSFNRHAPFNSFRKAQPFKRLGLGPATGHEFTSTTAYHAQSDSGAGMISPHFLQVRNSMLSKKRL